MLRLDQLNVFGAMFLFSFSPSVPIFGSMSPLEYTMRYDYKRLNHVIQTPTNGHWEDIFGAKATQKESLLISRIGNSCSLASGL